MAKKKIQVHTPFNFTNDDGSAQHFSSGEHSVDESIASHWFVLAHSKVTGSINSDDDKAFQSQIDSLTAQLGEKDKTIVDLQTVSEEKTQQIDSLTAQLAALQAPVVEEANNGKKSKSTDSK